MSANGGWASPLVCLLPLPFCATGAAAVRLAGRPAVGSSTHKRRPSNRALLCANTPSGYKSTPLPRLGAFVRSPAYTKTATAAVDQPRKRTQQPNRPRYTHTQAAVAAAAAHSLCATCGRSDSPAAHIARCCCCSNHRCCWRCPTAATPKPPASGARVWRSRQVNTARLCVQRRRPASPSVRLGRSQLQVAIRKQLPEPIAKTENLLSGRLLRR